MLLDDLSDMLMLGLTPSSSLLERRIRLMQDRSRAPAAMLAVGSIGMAGMVLIACAANPPASPASGPPHDVATDVPRLMEPERDNNEIHLQEAVTRYYGNLPLSEAKRQRILWFVFQHDWSVERHDIGLADAVEVSDEDLRPMYGSNLPARPVWSVNASIERKYPDLKGIGTQRSRAVSEFGGGRAVVAADTVTVFWARYAN